MYELKNNMKRCDICAEDFYGLPILEQHFAQSHPEVDITANSHPSLEWLVVLPGLDHLRMNAAKSIIHTYWEVFFKAICYQLGYESPAAQNVAFGCSDMHKTDQILGNLLPETQN